jgi:hypothetical protein
MKPYQEHLTSVLSYGENVSLTRKPVFRSSAIFPVIENSVFSTDILFMGYWLKKRNIPEVTILFTLRAKNGTTLFRKTATIKEIKAYKVPIVACLNEAGLSSDDFIGSIELEVFSTRDMVFPYPAFVVNYRSEFGSTAVHTTGRLYNDVEDMVSNTVYNVPESGFDIYSGETNHPFFCFVNGAYDNSDKAISYEIVDGDQNSTGGQIMLGDICPYQSFFVMLKDYIDIDSILKGKKGTIKLQLDFVGFFTRVIAGNFVDNKAVSITHTFYDSSSVKDKTAYLDNLNPELHDSYIFIPLFMDDDLYTHVVYYPIYSPSNYAMDIRFYNKNGNCLKEIYKWKAFSDTDNAFFTLDVNEIAKENFSKDELNEVKGMLIANSWNNRGIPTRIKYGLNVGIRKKTFDLPTNICFAPEISNPKMLNKPGTFKWAPILNINDSEVVITNCGPNKNYTRPANITIEFYREKDSEVLSETLWLLPYSQYRFSVKKFNDLSDFFGECSGWVTISSDNPFVNAWYFDFNYETGVVAGDHSF